MKNISLNNIENKIFTSEIVNSMKKSNYSFSRKKSIKRKYSRIKNNSRNYEELALFSSNSKQ